MAAPTFVSSTATAFNSSTSPKTTAAIAVQNGDIVVAHAFIENATSPNVCNITTFSGSTSAWTTGQEELGLNDGTTAYAKVATASATATGNITVRFTRSGGTAFFGGVVKVWRSSAGVGVAVENNNVRTSSAPSISITTTAANSALDYGSCDWNAVAGTATFTSSAGTPTTDVSDQTSAGANYCIYSSHVTDAGATGAKTIGMSAPATQRWVGTVVEIKGGAGVTHYTMPAVQGTLATSGQANRLAWARKPAGGKGQLTLAGPNVNLVYSGAGSKTLPAGIGFLALSGQAAILRRTRVMPAVWGTLTLSGQAATTREGRKTAGGLGILTLAGQANRLAWARKSAAGKGQLTLAGPVVNLIYSGAGAKTLPAGLGFPVLSGHTAVLRYSRNMPAAVSMAEVGGYPATLTYTAVAGDIVMPVSAGVLAMSGFAGLYVGRTLQQPGELKFGRKVYLKRW